MQLTVRQEQKKSDSAVDKPTVPCPSHSLVKRNQSTQYRVQDVLFPVTGSLAQSASEYPVTFFNCSLKSFRSKIHSCGCEPEYTLPFGKSEHCCSFRRSVEEKEITATTLNSTNRYSKMKIAAMGPARAHLTASFFIGWLENNDQNLSMCPAHKLRVRAYYCVQAPFGELCCSV